MSDVNFKIIFFICSRDTFYAKVIEYAGLKGHMVFQLIMPIYGAEIYFFHRSENLDESLARLLITAGSFNSAFVNSLYAEMLNAKDYLSNISFIGKINDADHKLLKKIVEASIQNLLVHVRMQQCTEESVNSMQLGVIDLTSGLIKENQIKHNNPSDETYYEINTSEIMEFDLPLDDFYDPEIRGLRDGWDAKVSDEMFRKNSYDKELMSKFLDCLLDDKNENPIVLLDEDKVSNKANEDKKLKRSKSDDDLQIVSFMPNTNSYGSYSGKWNLRERSNGKTERPVSTRMSSGLFKSGTRPTSKIKSNLFDDEEVVKWEKSKVSTNMSKLLSSTNKDFKNLTECLDKDYKIPRKSYNGPTPRPSIHSSTRDSKIIKQEANPSMMQIFQKRVENLVPYNSPSGHRISERNTPESVSKFFDVETIHVIDDDDENNNNNTSSSTNDKNEHKGPAKRRLLPISPKMFKNRRTDYNYYDSPFSSNVSRNSSSHRKL